MSALLGARNGLVYGGKVRFAHSLVMSLLFYSQKNGPKKSLKCLSALRILQKSLLRAWIHGRNLGTFVLLYKLIHCSLLHSFGYRHPIFALVAGMLAAALVWRKSTLVNQ